ncbi:hypothetical protein OAU25_00150 [Crocinitomicaceae bacterium]|nr:hypothetical protein [Crocinitomicaceae bacterium]
MQKTGGWEANKNEYRTILSDIYFSPEYWPILLQKSIEYSIKQFFSFEIQVDPPHRKGSPPFEQINWRFHDSKREYMISKQHNGKLCLGAVNTIQNFVTMSSIFALFALTLYPLRIAKELKWILVLCLIYGILNSVFCSNLSTIDPRFQNRWIWLLTLFTIIAG